MAHRNSLTDDELMELALKGNVSTKTSKRTKEIERFITKFQIKPGDELISPNIVYYHYFYSRQRDKMSEVAFYKIFGKYFDKEKKGPYVYYKLDPSSFDLSPDGLFRAKVFLRKRKYERKKNKKK